MSPARPCKRNNRSAFSFRVVSTLLYRSPVANALRNGHEAFLRRAHERRGSVWHVLAQITRQRRRPLSGGRAQSLRRGASGMDAAKGLGVSAIKGHGWPFIARPRSSDGARGVERARPGWWGKTWFLFVGPAIRATAKRDSPSSAKPESPGNSAISIDSMPASPSPRTDPNPAGQTTSLLSPSKSTKPKKP